MSQYINSNNALDPVENISYKKGRVVKADYLGNLLDVSCGGSIHKNLPVFYRCNGGENEDIHGSTAGGSFAFTLEDEVLVRFYNGRADRVCGFYGDLWPCIPMPAMAIASDTVIYSKNLFQNTEYAETDTELFLKRYTKISEKNCDTELSTYSNTSLPEDYQNRFIAVVMSGLSGDLYYRHTTVYFSGTSIYTTYNYETRSGGVFNGTRSNVIAAFVHPLTGDGVLVYQINTFTDWLPQVSGRVDFAFYIYCSSGYHELISTGYSIVSSEVSDANGTGISESSGFYTDTADTGYAFCMSASVENLMNFTAEAGEQLPTYSDKTQKLIFTLYYTEDGAVINISEMEYDSSEKLLMPDGEYRYAEINFYRKKS